METDHLCIGGGPAGVFAALTAAEHGKRCIILEHNKQLGRKLRITGKGRCNLTNNCDRDTLMANIPANGKFLYSAFSRCTPQDVMAYFEKLGVPLKTERGNRVFPVSDRAEDIVQALQKAVRLAGIPVVHGDAAELLLENPQENKPLLIRQKAWLESNLAKYPRNKSQIEAIEEALRLYEEGKLHQEETGGGYHTEIVYSSGMRPLIRRKRADGKCFVYEITIRWNGGADRPVEIEIRNYYAPVIQKDSGLLNVMAKDKADEVRNTISLTTDQWFWIEHILETNIHTFESLCAAKNYKMALEEERKEKEMVKKGGKIAS